MAPTVILYDATQRPPVSLSILLAFSEALPNFDVKQHFKLYASKKQLATGIEMSLKSKGICLTSEDLILRYLGRYIDSVTRQTLSGDSLENETLLDYCLQKAENLEEHQQNKQKVQDELKAIDEYLTYRTYLCGYSVTIGDIYLFSVLTRLPEWSSLGVQYPNIARWYVHCLSLPFFTPQTGTSTATKPKDFVVTRFPPEPSGYLHVGHAKAAILNYHQAKILTNGNGRLILRFDDTNPAKEKDEFVENIIKDLDLLKIDYDKPISYSSNYFDKMMELCQQMISKGQAYVDDTPVERMREERMEGIESLSRSHTIEENLELWKEMTMGSDRGQQCVVRAKIDMKHHNKALRDPAMYRCNLTPHHRTGTQYKVYPTYDFVCPVIDSIEGVTLAMRTNEYVDRDAQYFWFLDQLQLRKPQIYSYSRLNFIYTVLSKRKLTWFVETKRVTGWDDPRMPTVQGIVRRGMNIQALHQFVIDQGASNNTNLMRWDKLWALNKKIIDPTSPRFTGIGQDDMVQVVVRDEPPTERVQIRVHPKYERYGHRELVRSSVMYIEQCDAITLKEDEEVTFMNWGNMIIETIEKDENLKISKITVKLNLQGDVKTTDKKLTWIGGERTSFIPLKLIEVDYLITVEKLEEDQQFDQVVRKDTWFETMAWGEPCMNTLKHGDIVQLNRRGFFRVDTDLSQASSLSLIMIPDGKTKAASIIPRKVDLII